MLQVLGSVQTCFVPRLEVWTDAELLLCPRQGAAGWRPCWRLLAIAADHAPELYSAQECCGQGEASPQGGWMSSKPG